MKNTIKAKNGYSVTTYIGKKSSKTFAKVYVGEKLLYTAIVRSMTDYKDEKENNECFIKYEVFTANGKQFIYWGDWESNADYITTVDE